MARGRSAGYDDQREAIVARAAELFARHGYHATSMNQVAEAAGLSKATLYHYFRDKDALLVHIADGHVSRLQALVAEVRALGLKPEPQFRELVRRIVEEYADAQHAHRVLTEDVKFLPPADRQRILDKEREVVAGFAAVVARAASGAEGRRAGHADDHAAVRHDQLDVHLDEARRRARLRSAGTDGGGPVPGWAAGGAAAGGGRSGRLRPVGGAAPAAFDQVP